MPASIGTEKGLLHEVIGVRALARERVRESCDRIEVRQCDALEIFRVRGFHHRRRPRTGFESLGTPADVTERR
jgi:hypothetical protein